MEVWITKYALTQGIRHTEGEIGSASENMIVIKHPFPKVDEYFHGEGKEWHRSVNAAIAWAEKMRQDKIASLKKQINKLEKKSLVIVEG